MTKRASFTATLAIGLAGAAFAGYLSAFKLFTDTCALGESCPYFLGYPTCYYGFAMFAAIAVFSALGLAGKMKPKTANDAVLGMSLLGTLFAAWFGIPEIAAWYGSGVSYALVLPSCVYGLVFYLAAAGIALKSRS